MNDGKTDGARGGRAGNGRKGRERGKGFGTLERRGRVYIARWTVDGRRYSRSTGTADRREAERRLDEFTAIFRLRGEGERLEALAGRLAGVRGRIREREDAQPALPVADAFDAYEKSTARRDTAGEARLNVCRAWYGRFAAFLAERYPEIREVREVSREHAAAFAAEGYTGVCNATWNNAISFLRTMWRVLKADGAARVAENPWEGIQKRREVPSRRREMTLEEVSRAYAVLKGEMRLLFLVGIYTGQRLGDCALLEWGSVDLARRRITLAPRKTRKTGRTVVIPIHDNLFSALLSIPPERRRGYVMPECAGEYTANRLGAAFKAAFKAAGIATDAEGERGTRRRAVVSFHSLRHTFVSIAANAGIPLAVVQSIVGHSTPGMTRHYFHQSESALVSAVASLPCVGTAEGCGVSARLRSAIAAADALTADERRELVRHLTGGRAAIPPSGAGSAA